MAGNQDPNVQNANAWLAMAKGMGQTAWDNLQAEKDLYLGGGRKLLASLPSPAQSIKRDFDYGTLPGGSIPTAAVQRAPDGTRMSEPIPLEQLSQMGDKPMGPPMVLRPADQQADGAGSFASPPPPPRTRGGLPPPPPASTTSQTPDFIQNYQNLMDELKSKGGELSKKQQAEVDQLKGSLSGLLGQDLQYDLSPLASLVDQWTGSRLAQGYTRPETAQQRRQEISQAQKGISAADLGLTQTQMQQLQQQAGSQMDLGKFQADQQHKNTMEGFEKEKIGIERQKVAAALGKASNGKQIDVSAVKHISDGQNVLNLVSGLGKRIDQGKDLMGPVSGLMAGLPFATQHQELQADFDRTKQVVAKMMEGGVLRKEDEAKYDKIMPSIRDTPEVAKYKAKQLEQTLKQDLGTYVNTLKQSGFNTSGLGDLGPLLASSGGQPQTVTQNGHTYTWNSQTGSYE